MEKLHGIEFLIKQAKEHVGKEESFRGVLIAYDGLACVPIQFPPPSLPFLSAYLNLCRKLTLSRRSDVAGSCFDYKMHIPGKSSFFEKADSHMSNMAGYLRCAPGALTL